jgi:hypothetical protein
VDRLIASADAVGQWPHQVRVAIRQQPVEHFNHRDLGSQSVVDGGHLEADDAAADDQQPFGQLGRRQRAGGIDDPWVALREPGNRGRLRARGDDAVLKRQLAISHSERVRTGELRRALHHLDLSLLGEAAQAARQAVHDGGLPADQLGQVHRRPPERNPASAHLFGLGHHPGSMQERLGRDASDVQAHTAQPLVAFDQHGAQS